MATVKLVIVVSKVIIVSRYEVPTSAMVFRRFVVRNVNDKSQLPCTYYCVTSTTMTSGLK